MISLSKRLVSVRRGGGRRPEGSRHRVACELCGEEAREELETIRNVFLLDAVAPFRGFEGEVPQQIGA